MTWITRIALKKRWLTVLVAAMIAGASIWAMMTLKMELIPDIDMPMTTVFTVYPQAQPDEVMERVTVPIEETAIGIGGLKHTSSTSSEGSSFVFFQFEYGTDMDEVNRTLGERLAQIDLPAEVRNLPPAMPGLAENPRLFPIDMNQIPVVTLDLYGDVPAREMRQVAIDRIVPQLEGIDGVQSVSVAGGSEEKVLVNPRLEAMNGQGVSMGHLAAVLAMQEHQSVDSVRNAVLRPDGLLLRDVADVSVGLPPGSSVSRTNGKPSVSISVTKEAKANTVTTANAVLEEAEAIGKGLPSGMALATTLNMAEFIEASVSDLTTNAIIGSVLAIVVVFLFLMAFRASLVTAVSIPLSLLVGFLVMRFSGITINILTLSAMVIAVGRVIDNSIVILEVLYRRMQQGERFADAAINGVREVVVPITSATVATVVIFIPLAFVGGIVGEMFLPFGLTITYALIGSLLIALTIVPVLSGSLLRTGAKSRLKPSWYLRAYTVALRWCLGHRAVTLILATVLFLGSFSLVPIIGTSFMPEMNTGTLTVSVEMPEGTDFARVQEVVADVEGVLGTSPGVETYSAVAGVSGTSMGAVAAMFGGGGTGNSATITVITSSDAESVAETLASRLEGITEESVITVHSLEAMGAMTSGLAISVRGETYEEVAVAAERLIADLVAAGQGSTPVAIGSPVERRRQEMAQKALSQLTELELEIAPVEPKLVVEPDMAKAMALGLSVDQMTALQREFFIVQQGVAVGQANVNGVDREVFLEGVAGQLTDLDTARELMVGFPSAVALGDIANVEIGVQPTNISRIDGKTSATITAGIAQENVGAVNQAVQSRIDAMDFAPGIETSMGGVTEDMMESFSDMFVAIGIAMVLAFAVLVLTFRSFRNPVIIMVSLPLASIGALVGLLVTGHPLGVTGLMGVLMLVGIVLTNAVVLISVVEQMRKDGSSPFEALFEGARTRLRPILMTAITTMIAMVPLAFGMGEGLLMAAELAVVVIGGLFSSTVLTLLVIPAVYAVVNRVRIG